MMLTGGIEAADGNVHVRPGGRSARRRRSMRAAACGVGQFTA